MFLKLTACVSLVLLVGLSWGCAHQQPERQTIAIRARDNSNRYYEGKLVLRSTENAADFISAIATDRMRFLGECTTRYYAVAFVKDPAWWELDTVVVSIAKTRIDSVLLRQVVCEAWRRNRDERNFWQGSHTEEAQQWEDEHIRPVDWR